MGRPSNSARREVRGNRCTHPIITRVEVAEYPRRLCAIGRDGAERVGELEVRVAGIRFPDETTSEIIDFVKALQARGPSAPETRTALVGADNSRVEPPESLRRVLLPLAERVAVGQT